MDRVTRRQPRPGATNPAFDHIVKPIVRAYAFGHISTTGPKLVGIFYAILAGKKNLSSHFERLRYIVRNSLGLFRFPAFCASLVGIYSILSTLFISILLRLARPTSPGSLTIVTRRSRLAARFLAALVATWTTFPMVNRGDARYQRRRARSDVRQYGDPNMIRVPTARPEDEDEEYAGSRFRGTAFPPLAGRTLDLTILACVRAVETIIWHSWRATFPQPPRPQVGRPKQSLHRRVATFVGAHSDSALFIASCYAIMFAWFYAPDALPRSYRRWIGQCGHVDSELVDILRSAREGNFRYGEETGASHILEPMCKRYGYPLEWADPSKTIPVKCELVHQGTGPSCHYHKFRKFWQVWFFAMRMNLPLQLAFKMRKRNVQALKSACTEAARSSAFLGAFVTLLYYGVCLTRTIVGPKLLPPGTASRQILDSGWCVAAGCALCGWSVLIEPPKRRQELALFVAPRAAAVFLPPRYDRKYLNRERTAFAVGTSVLFALAHEDAKNVRGLIGSLLHTVIG